MSGSNDRRWLGFAVVLFVLLGIPFWEYRTDDTFIFLRYARNLAGGDGPSFNPGEPVFGFSSPLWLLVLAALERLGLGALAAVKIVSLAIGVIAVVAFQRFASRYLPARMAGVATVAWAANAWMIRWTASAMETALLLALILLALDAFERERRDAARQPWSALWLGLAALVRPEGAILVVLALGVMLIGWRAPRRAALGGVIVAALIVPWLAYAQRTMGAMLPVTGSAKGTVGLALDWNPLIDVSRIIVTTSGVELVLVVIGIVLGALALLSSRAGAGGGGGAAFLAGSHALPVLWLMALPLFYAATGFDVLSRYALPIVPVLVVYGFLALEHLSAARAWRFAFTLVCAVAAGFLSLAVAGLASGVALAVAVLAALLGGLVAPRLAPLRGLSVAVLVVVWNVAVLGGVVYPHTHAFTRGVADCFEGLGRWFGEHTPAGTQIAIADIGAFGYYSDRQVLDMAGLVSPELIPLVDQYPIQDIAAGLEFASIARPQYLVDRYHQPNRLAGTKGGTFEALPVDACPIAGLGVRSPETIYYTAYRLHWDRYDTWLASQASAGGH